MQQVTAAIKEANSIFNASKKDTDMSAAAIAAYAEVMTDLVGSVK